MRLPYAIAFSLTVLLLLPLGRDLSPARPRLPAVAYAAMLLPYIAANSVTTDTFLALFTTLYAAAFVRARALGADPRRRHVVLILGSVITLLVIGLSLLRVTWLVTVIGVLVVIPLARDLPIRRSALLLTLLASALMFSPDAWRAISSSQQHNSLVRKDPFSGPCCTFKSAA